MKNIPSYLSVPESLERGSQLDAVRWLFDRPVPSRRRLLDPFGPQPIERLPADRGRPDPDGKVPESIDKGMLFDGPQRRALRWRR